MNNVERGFVASARAAPQWLKDSIRWQRLGRTALALAPLLADYGFTHNPVALASNLILVSLCIGAARVGYGLPGLLLHLLVILGAFCALLFAQQVPVLFAALTTLFATAAVLLGRFRENWRAFGSFSLIPSVYLAMELFGQSHGLHPWATFFEVVRCSTLGFGFLAFLSWLWWTTDRRAGSFFASFGTPEPPNPRWHVMTLSVFIAEVLATTLITAIPLPNAQWVVWSVVSVVTGDSVSARRKLKLRALGGLVGVPLGLLAGFVVPHVAVGESLLAVAGVLTLVGFRQYLTEFGLRCFFIALAGSIVSSTHYPELIGLERIANVVLGGVVGLGVLLAVEAFRNRRGDEARALAKKP